MAIFQHVSAEGRFPIVNMFYDGPGDQNRRLEICLRTALATQTQSGPSRLRGKLDPVSCNASL